MLGAFFFIRQKILCELFILCFIIATPSRASDWTYCNFSVPPHERGFLGSNKQFENQ